LIAQKTLEKSLNLKGRPHAGPFFIARSKARALFEHSCCSSVTAFRREAVYTPAQRCGGDLLSGGTARRKQRIGER
jgi:hypothetical protein